MGGMAAARMADEIGHVGVWARIARVALRVGSAMVEGALVPVSSIPPRVSRWDARPAARMK